MESASNLIIALDAGHGGWDNGALFETRREKDDNLRLCLEAKLQLKAQGFGVICTREADSFVPLAKRTQLVNDQDADLLISLHRSYFSTPSDEACGASGFIYPTASLETSGRAAQLVLSALEEAGVQRMVGISRAHNAVLRRATMPAMLLEVGFLSNPADNRLFDENLINYARAIAKGVTQFFGLNFNEKAKVGGARAAAPPLLDENEIFDMQQLLESRYGFGLSATGRLDDSTRKAAVIALQIELNGAYEAEIAVNGSLSPQTLSAIRPIRPGDSGGLCALLQVLLILNGYEPGDVDGYFGRKTGVALRFFQRDQYIIPSGIAAADTLIKLIRGR